MCPQDSLLIFSDAFESGLPQTREFKRDTKYRVCFIDFKDRSFLTYFKPGKEVQHEEISPFLSSLPPALAGTHRL